MELARRRRKLFFLNRYISGHRVDFNLPFFLSSVIGMDILTEYTSPAA
jgi:hypothetical protein